MVSDEKPNYIGPREFYRIPTTDNGRKQRERYDNFQDFHLLAKLHHYFCTTN